MSQNDFSQLDCRILISTTSPEKKKMISELYYWHAGIDSSNLGVFKNALAQLDLRIFILATSQ